MLRAPSSRASIAIIFALISIPPWPTHSAKMSYVQEACSVTQHQDLCIQSLSPFSSSAKRSPTKWAKAGVSVTISEAKTVARFLGRVKNGKRLMGRNRAAVSDCVEVCEAAIAELHRSLGFLRRLGKRNLIRNRVVKAGYITSNALALISKLAASGFQTAPTQ
ncbi:Pectinesterase inhibitor 6, partial [Cucurbita argyrosperma subsp. argyrosperma]